MRTVVARLRRNTQSAIVGPLRSRTVTAPPCCAALSSKVQPTIRVAPEPPRLHADRAAGLHSEHPSAPAALSKDRLELTQFALLARKAACSTVSAPSETYTAPPNVSPPSVGWPTATSPDMLTCRSTSVTPAPTASTRDGSGVPPCPQRPRAWPWMTTALVAVQEGSV